MTQMKRKYPTIFFFTLLIFLIMIGMLCFADNNKSILRATVSWDETTSTGRTYLYQQNDIYYAFLPSYADMSQLTFHTDVGHSAWLDDVLWQHAALTANHKYTLSIKNAFGIPIARVPLILMKSENIPAISIQLYNSTMADIAQNREECGYMSLIDSDNTTIYSGDFAKFHVRGNHTATLPKKPYALKFSEDVDLLGTGGFTSYCLVANAEDESKLRNKLAYETAKELGLEHSPESMFVDLYVDNVYYGLYLLADKIDVGENRINLNPLQDQIQALNFFNLQQYEEWSSSEQGILRKGLNIPSNPDDITGGYLLEVEVHHRIDMEPNVFITDRDEVISIKYPEYCSQEQVNYIADFFQELEDSSLDGSYAQYIDVESWAKFYLIQEYFAQTDRTSIFFYKDSDSIDPKLYAGPVWDFDWSIGLSESYSRTYQIEPFRFYFNWDIFGNLWEDPTFHAKLASVYQSELYPLITEFLPSAIDYYEQQIAASHAMDKCRWDSIFIPLHGPYADSLDGSLLYLKDWLSLRTGFLSSHFLTDPQLIQLTLHYNDNDETSKSYDLVPGSTFFPELYNLNREGYRFKGWFDSDGTPITEHIILEDNTVLYAKWDSGQAAAFDTDNSQDDTGKSAVHSLDVNSALADMLILLMLFSLILLVLFLVFRDIIKHIRQERKQNACNE